MFTPQFSQKLALGIILPPQFVQNWGCTTLGWIGATTTGGVYLPNNLTAGFLGSFFRHSVKYNTNNIDMITHGATNRNITVRIKLY